MKMIYLDFNATTPIHPEVADAMRPYLNDYFGNPSSTHWYGTTAKMAIEKARSQVARLLNCQPEEIIFTSGGSESNNMALKGAAFANREKGNHIITSVIEHPAVSEVCKYLEKQGFKVSYVEVDKYGMVQPEKVAAAITSDTILISIMHANNETGTIQPIREISEIARNKGILIHTDAAQSTGKIQVDVEAMGIDLLSVAGHKLYAPKGVGVLFIRNGTRIEKLIHGADHEHNLRAGTENVLEIIGLGQACQRATDHLEERGSHLKQMRDMLFNRLTAGLTGVHLLGHPGKRLPNTLYLGFESVEANTLLSELNHVAASAGAACHSGEVDLSHVLTAMQIPVRIAMGAVRFSTGYSTTRNEIEEAAKQIIETVQKLKLSNDTGETAAEPAEKIKLTHFTHGLGCACKIRPQVLEKVLQQIPVFQNKNVLVNLQTNDDAAIYQIDKEHALIETVDFFTPIVDDPYYFGAIAAANSLSDVYAMGGKPLFAMNLVGFPSNRLPISVLENILKGASDKTMEAGIGILGGHTIDDTEPKFGLVVSGMVHPEKIWRNSGARAEDVIILTKPIGTGILATALKQEILDRKTTGLLIQTMAALNKQAAEIASSYPVNACTDITGFGLLGHLMELLKASQVSAEIYLNAVPVLPKVREMASAGILPGGSKNNLDYVAPYLVMAGKVSQTDQYILADAQTSGGLLISLPAGPGIKLLKVLLNAGLHAAIIGKILRDPSVTIRIST